MPNSFRTPHARFVNALVAAAFLALLLLAPAVAGGPSKPACRDGKDNDGDGKADYPADPGCSSRDDNDESDGGPPPPAPQCNDGTDNDGDGKIDYPADAGCSSASDNDESGGGAPPPPPQCNDGKDNDGDGRKDYPADRGCTSANDNDESGPGPHPTSYYYFRRWTDGPVNTVKNFRSQLTLEAPDNVDPAVRLIPPPPGEPEAQEWSMLWAEGVILTDDTVSITLWELARETVAPSPLGARVELLATTGSGQTTGVLAEGTLRYRPYVQDGLSPALGVYTVWFENVTTPTWYEAPLHVRVLPNPDAGEQDQLNIAYDSILTPSCLAINGDPGCDPTKATPECADGRDNDGRNGIDYPQDGGCFYHDDVDEYTPPPAACEDRIDNDGDGKVDFLDPGCEGWGDDSEADPSNPPACADGVDNDHDGATDYPEDAGCDAPSDNDEYLPPSPPQPQCNDGVDNDHDGKTDMADRGCGSSMDDNEADDPPLLTCEDGLDNDGDGYADYPADPGCSSATDTDEMDGALPPTPPLPQWPSGGPVQCSLLPLQCRPGPMNWPITTWANQAEHWAENRVRDAT